MPRPEHRGRSDGAPRISDEAAVFGTERAAPGTNRARRNPRINCKVPGEVRMFRIWATGKKAPQRDSPSDAWRRLTMRVPTSSSTRFIATMVTFCLVQVAAAADPPPQSNSAPLRILVAPLTVSSAPPSITFAPPRPAPASTPATTAKSEVPEVRVVASLKDRLPTSGYRRIVFEGQEYFCRNDLATGSHVERSPSCLTAAQWQKQQLRAQEWMDDVEHRAAAEQPSPAIIGGVAR
jgi:hypothetical protein